MPLTVRMRRSPFFERSFAAQPKSMLVYNHTLIAADFESAEADCRHLREAVQLWDVGCERQVEIVGPDALRLVQMATPRHVGAMRDDQCFYAPTVDANGGMTNDPVLVKVGPDHYWLSIADSDLLLYFKALAAGLKLNVTVQEPDVSPLGIQGPLAQTLVERVWGKEAAQIRFFRHTRVAVHGKSMLLARSGFSTQDGFELYYDGAADDGGGGALWDELMEAGRDLDIRVGSPCQIDRIEGGMLSYLSDITPDMTPFEAGLGRVCHLDSDIGCLGFAALREKRAPTRQLRPVRIEGGAAPPMTQFWPVIDEDGERVGRISSCTWSYAFGSNAAIGLIDQSHWSPGTRFRVLAPDGERAATVLPRFWRRN
ncbi:MAG: dimethylsulfoniopropionate demethylase [Pseudomonadota bacterium]